MMGNIDIYIITKITFVSQTLNIIYSKNKNFILEFGDSRKKTIASININMIPIHLSSKSHRIIQTIGCCLED